MIKKRRYAFAAVLMAAVMAVVSGCQSRTSSSEPPSSDSVSLGSQPEHKEEDNLPPYLFVNPLDPAGIIVPGIRPVQVETYELTSKVRDARAINTDVGAYLYIPDTLVDEPILTSSQYGGTKAFQNIYDQTANRLNWKREGTGYGGAGVAYLHYKANINSRGELSPNLVIFGHNNGMPYGQTYNAAIPLEDRPDGAMFAQLYKYLDEEFTANHPYLFFSTEKEDYIYQVIAVSYTDEQTVPKYYSSSLSSEDALIAAKDMMDRSQWIYEDVELKAGDKFLTLSTCTYSLTTQIHNPYRYVIMGRLLPAGAKLSPTANITKNPSPKAPKGL